MQTLHPAFDIKTATWFVDGQEAKTLAALLILFPKDTKFEGYWPEGYQAVRPKGDAQRVYLPIRSSFNLQSPDKYKAATLSTKTVEPPKPKRYTYTPKLNKPRRYDHNAVLDLWAQGFTGPAIGQRLGLHSSTTAAQIVCQYRGIDPRTVARGRGWYKK